MGMSAQSLNVHTSPLLNDFVIECHVSVSHYNRVTRIGHLHPIQRLFDVETASRPRQNSTGLSALT